MREGEVGSRREKGNYKVGECPARPVQESLNATHEWLWRDSGEARGTAGCGSCEKPLEESSAGAASRSSAAHSFIMPVTS